jgi:LysR family nitrogen assimilation transcriptional regulator
MERPSRRDDLASSISFSMLRTYVRVVELGSITRAAESLYLAQSAVSAQMSALASHAGGPLLERRDGKLAATDLGRILYVDAGDILGRLDDLHVRLRESRNAEKERIAVTCTRTVCETSVAKIVSQFAHAHPTMHLSISSATIKDAELFLRAGTCDVALVEGLAELPGASSLPFHSDRLLLAMPPGHPLALLEEVRFEDVAAYPMIVRSRASGTRVLIEQRLGRRFERLSIALELDGIAEIVSCVEAGIGTTFVARTAIADALALRTIVARRVADVDLSRVFYAAIPGDRPIPPATNVFVNWLASRYANQPAELISA